MISVGLVGEDPHDTISIKNLLNQRYKRDIVFKPLASRIRGYQLDNPKIARSLHAEWNTGKFKFIVFIRDLDGFKSEPLKIKTKLEWFEGLNKISGGENVLLLNIWEIEALIFGDIETFNKMFNTSINFKGDPMYLKDPKEILMRETRKGKKQYREHDCPQIFSKLNIDIIEKKCVFFQNFLQIFDDVYKMKS